MYYSLRSLSTICNCSFQQASIHICQRKTQLCFSSCVQALGHAVVCGGVLQIAFKSHSTDYRKLLEISHWDALERLKSLLKWPMSANLSLESDNKVTAGKTLKPLTKLLDWLRGIGRRYDEGMESRSVMVAANGMVHKLKEELKDDDALLFGLIFLAYLDIGGECLCLFFPLFAFMCILYFGLALAVLSSKPTVQ